MTKRGEAVSKIPEAWKAKKLPKKLGDCVDLIFDVRAARRALESQVELLKKEEDRVKEHVIQTFKKEEIDGARGKRGSVSLKEKDVPRVTDWEAFYAHVKQYDAFDLLQKRPGEAACQARWEASELIPGVEKFHKVDVSLNEK